MIIIKNLSDGERLSLKLGMNISNCNII